MDGGAAVPVTPEGVVGRVVSPDGRFVLGLDRARGAYVRYPVEGGEALRVEGFSAGERPVEWSADGRSVFAFRLGELPARVYRVDIETGQRELWRELTPPDPAGVDGIGWLKVTPDGAAYVYGYIRVLSDLYLVEGLR